MRTTSSDLESDDAELENHSEVIWKIIQRSVKSTVPRRNN